MRCWQFLSFILNKYTLESVLWIINCSDSKYSLLRYRVSLSVVSNIKAIGLEIRKINQT